MNLFDRRNEKRQLVKLNHVSLWTEIKKIKVVIKSIKERRMMKKSLSRR